MADLTVLRMGRLGDLVMVEPALRWLAGTPGLRSTLVTDARYAAAFDRLFPVPVVRPEARPHADLDLDLHRVAASRRLRRRPWVGVDKEDLRRRLRLRAPWLGVLPRASWPARHLDAAARAMTRLGVAPGARPDPIPRLTPTAAPEPGLLGLCPGAGWETKKWPVQSWQALVEDWSGPVVVFAGPGEGALAAQLGAEVWPDPTLTGLVDGLSRCEVVVAGDTGPLHLAGALGRKVVGLFGPTPTNTGFWVWGGQGTALSGPAACAPCSMHGNHRCPRSHHRCLRDLAPAAVAEAASALLRPSSERVLGCA